MHNAASGDRERSHWELTRRGVGRTVGCVMETGSLDRSAELAGAERPDPILVTGGAGFIGSAFVRAWMDRPGAWCCVLDALTYAGNRASLAAVADHGGFRFVRGDIADGDGVRTLLDEVKPGAVIHFAAETHVDRSIDDPLAFVRTNVLGTAVLLHAVRDYWLRLPPGGRERFRFLAVSTDEVYGDASDAALPDEEAACRPNSPYAASKAGADHLARAYGRTWGLPVVTTRSGNTYGPFQYPEKLVPLMILNAADGRALPVYGDGGNVRDWIHVDDHCAALRRVLAAAPPGETINIAAGEPRTNLEVVHAICDAVDRLRPGEPGVSRRSLIRFVEDRPGHDHRYAMRTGRLRDGYGWRPRVAFADGIDATVAWYLAHRDWADEVLGDRYDRGRLGLA